MRAAFLMFCLTAAIPASAQKVTDRAPDLTLGPAVTIAASTPQRWTLAERMTAHGVPGTSVAVIRDGKLAWTQGWGVLQAGGRDPVTADTIFSVGSLSKVATATIVLRLVDAGRLDLDRDVSTYLRSWRLRREPAAGDAPVTLRRLLSHTAGIGVSGFPDFQPGEPLPTVEQSLDGVPPAKVGPIAVIAPPGSTARYSGGGTTIIQAVIADVLGIPFERAAQEWLFRPLRMSRSTFVNPLDPALEPIAKAHGPDGRPTALPRGYEAMPELAASGLWTTSGDYARMLVAILASARGEPGAVLSSAIAQEMLREVSPGPVGLGPFLDGRGMTRRFYHSGSNDSYKAWFEVHEATGDGVVVFTNGANGAQLYPEVVRAVAAAEKWRFPAAIEVPRVAVSQALLDSYAGRYQRIESASVTATGATIFPFPSRLVIARDGDRLVMSDADRPEISLTLLPADDVNFVQVDDPDRWISFRGGRFGSPDRMVVSDGQYAFEAQRQP